MKTPTRLVIFVSLLLLALTVLGVGVTAVPAPYAGLPLGAGLSLFLLDFSLVLPWYQAGRRKDRHQGPVTPEDVEEWKRRFLEAVDKNRGPYPTPPREHWGQYGPEVPGARWRNWDDGQ